MSTPLHHLKELVSEGRYEVDEELVAEAIITRIQRHRAVRASAVVPTATPPPRVRSFRRAAHARSFHLVRSRGPQSPMVQFV